MSEEAKKILKNEELDKLLKFDALDTAEKIMGEDYKGGNGVMGLGFLLMQANSRKKEEILMAEGDTLFSNKLDRYLTIVKGIGFEVIYEEAFQTPPWNEGDAPRNETYFIMARHDGLLLSFDTYGGDSINGGHLYYNWKPHDNVKPYRATSSGGWEFPEGVDRYTADMSEATWVGSHDCREALVFNITRLEENGNFVTPWIRQPFLWLSHHGDQGQNDYDGNLKHLIDARIEQFPEWAKEIFIPGYEPTSTPKL